jgi:triosephosphate isomerase
MRKPLIAGNWKMYKTNEEVHQYVEEFKRIYKPKDVLVAICAPYTQLFTLKESLYGSGVRIGAQNMHFMQEGAYTGEISSLMLKEIGIDYCIIGHSERRQYFGETDEHVNKKLHTAFSAGIMPILCVGEGLEDKDGGRAADVVKKQVSLALADLSLDDIGSLTIAYEPIWAIGTGRTASPSQAGEMCKEIRRIILSLYGEETASAVKVLYGGSVKPGNISDLMEKDDIDGALVGGASLKPSDFIDIINF